MDKLGAAARIRIPGSRDRLSLVGSMVSQMSSLWEKRSPLAANRGWTLDVYLLHEGVHPEVVGTTVAWNCVRGCYEFSSRAAAAAVLQGF